MDAALQKLFAFPHRHLLDIEALSRDDIEAVLNLADAFYPIAQNPKRHDALRGKTIVNVFMEPSTRTRSSFEIAGKRLAADVINISETSSSIQKGESLLDTVQNLVAMKADVIVLRHRTAGTAHLIAQHVNAAVINAGDGMHEHPTQALLDAATIRKHKGKTDGLVVSIIGDVAHSRVARSNIHALNKLGAHVRVAAPFTLLPAEIQTLGVEVFNRVEPALVGADVVMVLRLQKERQDASLIPNLREYSRYFGVNGKRLALAKNNAIVMHPGPINLGIEIDPEVVTGQQSVILEQVTYGVATRMAVLCLLSGTQVEGSNLR